MSWQPASEARDRRSALAQVLEDALGRRALVAALLLIDSSRQATAELVARDVHLSRLIAETLGRLGLRAPDAN